MPSTIELKQSDAVAGSVADGVLCINADELLADDNDRLAESVRSACLETGFFFVDLTASQRVTLAASLAQMEQFFALTDDDERKLSVRQSETSDSGWVPKYTEPAYQPDTVSSLEAFDFGCADVEETASGMWPQLPDFRSDLSACWQEFSALSAAILDVIGQAAALPDGFLIQHCDSQQLNTMRLLNYAPEVIKNTDRDVGIAAHTDFECITLLYQTAAGLELLDVNGNWLDAPVREGRIVVLLDDMLERWTNGQFKATGHRVRNTEEQRYSIVMFVAANDDIEIAPLPQFVSDKSPARYPKVRQEQHIEDEVRRAKENAAGVRPL